MAGIMGSKPTRIIKGKEEVNELGKPGNELVNSLGWLKGQEPRKVIRGKYVVIGSKKPKGFRKKLMGVKEVKRK